jgi:hypothetical protein
MRKRSVIEADGTRKDILVLEVLLDIRDLLAPKVGRPKGAKNKKSTEVCEK